MSLTSRTVVGLSIVLLTGADQSQSQRFYNIICYLLYSNIISGFKYSFVDQNIEDMNITEVAEEWTENRNVVREMYNSSLEGVLHAIRKAE